MLSRLKSRVILSGTPLGYRLESYPSQNTQDGIKPSLDHIRLHCHSQFVYASIAVPALCRDERCRGLPDQDFESIRVRVQSIGQPSHRSFYHPRRNREPCSSELCRMLHSKRCAVAQSTHRKTIVKNFRSAVSRIFPRQQKYTPEATHKYTPIYG